MMAQSKPVTLLLMLMAACYVQAADSPRCSIRSGGLGAPATVVNEAVFSPIFFSANNQFGRDEVLIEELKHAARAGISFFSFNLPTPWFASEDEILKTVDTFCSAHPTGYFYVRIWVGAPKEWLDQHPDECIAFADGQRFTMASPSSEIWREAAAEQLRRTLTLILDGPHASQFLGAMVTFLQTGEWFYPRTDEFMDYSPANLAAFRRWLKQTYRRDKALRAAWGDPDVSINAATIPSPEQREATGWGVFRDPVRHRPAMDLERFTSETMAETIDYFAGVVKAQTNDRALAGAFYGYTFELNHNGPRALAHSGHLALARLLESKNIDLIHAPYAYFERGLGEPGHFHFPVDSIPLHGKLAIIEEDTYTHLSQPPDDGLIAPGWEMRTKTIEETLAISRRNIGNFLMHRCGFWFFDLLSDGRWNSREFWDSVGLARRIAAELRSEPPFQPEIAFAADEESVPYLADTTHPLLLESLALQRHELARLGAPVGYYLASDLSRLPKSVKVLILPNLYHVSGEDQRALDKFLDAGGAIVWVYTPGIMGRDGPDVSRVRATTGFNVAARMDGSGVNIYDTNNHVLMKNDTIQLRPRLIITAPPEFVLARYGASDEIAIAARPQGNGAVVYCAAPRVPLEVLARVCENAGVHSYRESPGHVATVGPYFFVHSGSPDSAEPESLAWPEDLLTLTRIVPPARFPASLEEGRQWRDTIPANATAIYHCEPIPGK